MAVDIVKVKELVDQFLAVIAELEVDPTAALALEAEAATKTTEVEAIEAQAAAIRLQIQSLFTQAASLKTQDASKVEAAKAIYAEIGDLLELVGEVPPTDTPPTDTPPTDPVPSEIGTEITPGNGSVLTSNGTWEVTADAKLVKDGLVLPETNSVTRVVVAEDPNDPTKTTIRQYAWGTSWFYAPGHPGANSAGWLVETWTPPVEIPPPATDGEWTLFPTAPVVRWDYNQVYHPIEGPQSGKQPAGWAFLFNNVVPQADGSLACKITNFGASAIKWELEKKAQKTEGLYRVKAKIPALKNGVVINPLWLYSEGAVEPGHEYDVEMMNGRFEYNLHNGNGGITMKSVAKDLSGHTVIVEINRRRDKVVMSVTSLTDGFTDSLSITPEFVAGLATRPNAPVNLRFPGNDIPMFPANEAWVSKWPEWSGTWVNLPAGESIDLVMLGYQFLP